MADITPTTRRFTISGRELFICDAMIDPDMVTRIGTLLKGLVYKRKEKSLPGVPGLAAVSDIAPEQIPNNSFLLKLRAITESLFPGEQISNQRAYVNSAVYGDGYFVHRDCAPEEHHITALYYANLEWNADWGGETLFYNEDRDAELAVSPRPGRLVVSRGGILHRATVPSRVCYEERLTLAYKLNSTGPLA